MLDYKFLFNYLQLWRSDVILSATTHIIMVKMSTISRNTHRHFLTFFLNGCEFLVQVLHAYYVFLSTLDTNFYSITANCSTKLCHIKCDHPACVLADGGHFKHMMVVALNMA